MRSRAKPGRRQTRMRPNQNKGKMHDEFFSNAADKDAPAQPGLPRRDAVVPFTSQLLKWVGNKQRFAHEIISFFPETFGTYYEPFMGAGGIMAALAPRRALGSDAFGPLVEIWQTLAHDPETLKRWYTERWEIYNSGDRVTQYETIKASYNTAPNGADLLFLCRACYGGIVRFRKADGYMSTPCGVHAPIHPNTFATRADIWHRRLKGAAFEHIEFEQAMARAQSGDLIYCDPPYTYSQAILYGAQDFSLEHLMDVIASCKRRGIFVALSIDGTKKSGHLYCDIKLPDGLFEREILVNIGRSMLRRFQMGGQTLETEEVRDRLLLTY